MTDDPRLGKASASSFDRTIACPGSVGLIASMPTYIEVPTDTEVDDVAKRGTRIHEARATNNTINLKDDSEVEAYKNWCRLELSVIAQWKEDNGIREYFDGISEERYWLRHPDTLNPLMSGQLDVSYRDLFEYHALIVDGKTSYAYYCAPANRNWQGRIYSLLLWKEYPELRRIRMAFVKPEIKFGAQIDWVDFTTHDLQNIERFAMHALWQAEQPDAPLIAGPHCIFCPARGICAEAASYSTLPALNKRRGDSTNPLELIKVMPIESAAEVWRKRKEIDKIMDAIAARLSQLPPEILSGLDLKLAEGRRADFIRDVQGAFNLLKDKGYDEAQLFATLDFNKERLIQLIMANQGVRKDGAEYIYERDLDEFIERARNKPSLKEIKR